MERRGSKRSLSAAGAERSGGGRLRTRRSASGVALRRKVRELRRLVPGGEDAPARSLLVRTADYIVRLRARVELLRAISALYDDLPPRHDGAAAADAGV
uniref:BHLH domain-containing protein n=1 Tax=Leersia perrieri TaxID=77586 RepID=A0A0D9X7T3_9ORYZ